MQNASNPAQWPSLPGQMNSISLFQYKALDPPPPLNVIKPTHVSRLSKATEIYMQMLQDQCTLN